MDGMRYSCLKWLGQDSVGATAVEFALLAPVFMTLAVGVCDIGQEMYASAVLRGAVEEAARSSSLETGDTAAADARVRAIMQPILPGVTVTASRSAYKNFTDVATPEPWSDNNANGTCDNGEIYTDKNGNGNWDADVGVTGNGSAGDVVIYTVNADYTPIFRIPFAPSSWNARRLTAVAVRKNQPWSAQLGYGSAALTCD